MRLPVVPVVALLAAVALAGCSEDPEAYVFVSAFVGTGGSTEVMCFQNATVGIATVSVRNDGPGQPFDIMIWFQLDDASMPREEVGSIKTIPVDATRALDAYVDLRAGCGPEGELETHTGTFTAEPSNGPTAEQLVTWVCNWETWPQEDYMGDAAGDLHC